MKRSEAISQASDFLGTKFDLKTGGTAKKIKEKGKENNLNRAQLNQIVADVFQRGADPKDIDLRKIDFSTSYDNIRGQVKELVKQTKGESAMFESEKQDRRDRISARAKKQMADRNRTLAETIHEQRPDLNQYVDETRTAERTFDQPTNEQFDTWKRNPTKYDIKGVDARKEPAARQNATLPFEEKQSITEELKTQLQTDKKMRRALRKDREAKSSTALEYTLNPDKGADMRSDTDKIKNPKGSDPFELDGGRNTFAPYGGPENLAREKRKDREKMPDDIPLSGGRGLMRYQYRSKRKAKKVAKRLGLSGVHQHEKNGDTIYMPGTNHKKLNRALERENMPPAMKPGQGSGMNMGRKAKLAPGTQNLTTGQSNASKLLSGSTQNGLSTEQKEKVRKQKQSAGSEQFKENRKRLAFNQNALIREFDVPDVLDPAREKRKKRIKKERAKTRGKNVTAMKDTEAKARKRRSSMDDRTEQEGLRSGGFVSMENEKTIDKFTDGESNASKLSKGEVNYF
jgi:hypothetical protein